MGFATGEGGAPPPAQPVTASVKRRAAGGTTLFWGALGAGAAGVLAWLVVDLGGPRQMVTALSSAGGISSEWVAIRQDLRQMASSRAARSPQDEQELHTLRRRVVLLEDMLTSPGAAQKTLARAPSASRAPRETAAIPIRKPQQPVVPRFAPLSDKVDLPSARQDGARIVGVTASGQAYQPASRIESQIMPMNMATAPSTAKRSRLAPEIVYGLDLGAYESIEVLKQRWNLVEGRHRDVLGDLVPRRITEFSADGRTAHRLIAAPLGDAMEVARRCASLQARSVPCKQTHGTGEPL